MLDLYNAVQTPMRKASGGWMSFNAPCCHNRGHRQDKKRRGGIKQIDNNTQVYHCFNCGFSCSNILGKYLSSNLKTLLTWLGYDQEHIARWNLESISHKDILDLVESKSEEITKRLKSVDSFKEVNLSKEIILDELNPTHTPHIDYIKSRGFSLTEFPFMYADPKDHFGKEGIVIPCTFDGKIVGKVTRYLNPGTALKYKNEYPHGYMFGYDMQRPDWEACIVVEGILDALSINGCALGHAEISPTQAALLYKLHRKIIIVPDQDETGLNICDQALGNGFYVSIPYWDEDVKDVNDAVLKYGKIPTLLSILQNATKSAVTIRMRRMKIENRLHS